jgi:opacity protein-like surface antigen
MIRRILILTSLVLLLASSVQAQTYGGGSYSRDELWEFSIQTRLTADQTYDGDGGSSVTLREDLGWGFGFGYNFNQHWYLGMIVAWRSLPYTTKIIDADDSQSSGSYNGQMDVSTFGLEGTGYISSGRVTPYVSGAIGWTLIDTNVYAGTVPACWWDPWWGRICGNVPATYGKNVVTYNLGVGGRFELSDSFHVRLGYEYGQVDAASISGTSMIRLDIGWRFI